MAAAGGVITVIVTARANCGLSQERLDQKQYVGSDDLCTAKYKKPDGSIAVCGDPYASHHSEKGGDSKGAGAAAAGAGGGDGKSAAGAGAYALPERYHQLPLQRRIPERRAMELVPFTIRYLHPTIAMTQKIGAAPATATAGDVSPAARAAASVIDAASARVSEPVAVLEAADRSIAGVAAKAVGDVIAQDTALEALEPLLRESVQWLLTPPAPNPLQVPDKHDAMWWFVRGPSGIGKTRLADEFATALTDTLTRCGVAAHWTYFAHTAHGGSEAPDLLMAHEQDRELAEVFLATHTDATDRRVDLVHATAALHTLLRRWVTVAHTAAAAERSDSDAKAMPAPSPLPVLSRRQVWICVVDEAQWNTRRSRGLLRACSRWNGSSVAQRGVDLLIIPVLCAPSDFHLLPHGTASDLYDVTGFQRRTVDVGYLMFDSALSLMAEAYGCEPERLPQKEYMLWFLEYGGWPVAYEQLAKAFRLRQQQQYESQQQGTGSTVTAVAGAGTAPISPNSSIADVHVSTPLSLLQLIRTECNVRTLSRYMEAFEQRFSGHTGALRRLLLLAFSGAWVQAKLRLNGFRLDEFEPMGFFRLQNRSDFVRALKQLHAGDTSASAYADEDWPVPDADLTGAWCRVDMPLLVARHLAASASLQLIPPQLQLATQPVSWMDFEQLAAWALQLRLACARELHGVPVGDRRAVGAAAGESADAKASASAVPAPVPTAVPTASLGSLRDGGKLVSEVGALRVCLRSYPRPGELTLLADVFAFDAFPIERLELATADGPGKFAAAAVAGAMASADSHEFSPARPSVRPVLLPSDLLGRVVLCAANQPDIDYFAVLPVVDLSTVDTAKTCTAAIVRPVATAKPAAGGGATRALAVGAAISGALSLGDGKSAPTAGSASASARGDAKGLVLFLGQAKLLHAEKAEKVQREKAGSGAGVLLEVALWSGLLAAAQPFAQSIANYYQLPVLPVAEVFATKSHRPVWEKKRQANWSVISRDDVQHALGPLLAACLGPSVPGATRPSARRAKAKRAKAKAKT